MVTPYIIVHEFFHLTQKLIIKDIEFPTLWSDDELPLDPTPSL